MQRPEILAPGGSFAAAYHAIEAGADGVYLGLREFSARKAAVNFDPGQLRRIRGLAAARGRRVYVALNTVVRDDETGRLAEALAAAEALHVDGVIVQDLGVAALARQLFPALPLHASTQMAVHNAAGLAELARLGFQRAILARELTLDEIAALRRAVPAIELEVFVHGALCYSFSGACLASWALTGRSGNRGDCAQICRGRFSRGDGPGRAGGPAAAAAGSPAGGPSEGTFFSCRDLFLGRDALALARIGVAALKIEGRMKSPEYAAAVVRLYRAVIDRGDDLDDAEYERLARAARTAFAREPTTGWLRSSSGSRLVDSRFPGHRGDRLGVTVTGPRGARGTGGAGGWLRLRIEADLSVRDGVAFMADGGTVQQAFSVAEIREGGKHARFARAGAVVDIRLPDGVAEPSPGTEIRHLSSRFQDLTEPREGSVAPYRAPLEVSARIAGVPGGGAMLALSCRGPVAASVEEPVTLRPADRPRPFVDVLGSVLAESGDSPFTAGTTALENRTGLPDDGIFVPPSELKRARSRFYARLDEAWQASVAARVRAAATGPVAGPGTGPAASDDGFDLAPFADRSTLSPADLAPLPFARRDADGSLATGGLAVRAGLTVVPLPPVALDLAPWIDALRALLSRAPGTRLLVGLNNVSHLAVADALAGHPGVSFFGDVFLYAANRWTVDFLARRVPRLRFVYRWIEDAAVAAGAGSAAGSSAAAGSDAGTAHRAGSPAVPVLTLLPGFRVPLFTSRGCFAKHVLNGGACFEDCPREFRVPLRQGGRRFEAIVADCMTYLFGA